MKYNWHRGLPLMVLLVDLVALWANMTNNDFVTLDNLRFHLMHLTGHLLDVRLYDWVFDLLQSLPEPYSDFNTEELVHQLTAKLEHYYCFFLKINALVLIWWLCRAFYCIANKRLSLVNATFFVPLLFQNRSARQYFTICYCFL